jgi:hypothetical protein
MNKKEKTYFEEAQEVKEKLNAVSPSMCMSKWLQVSLHLPQGLTQSCYHPPTHKVPLEELKRNPNALHHTSFKKEERKMMIEGDRPPGCQYCWNIEDAANGPHLSDRHYRSSEWWVGNSWDRVLVEKWDSEINPPYVEVNFNQACNFKCVYCSPHLSTAWEKEILEYGPIEMNRGVKHNDIAVLDKVGLMPLKLSNKENPYVEAFWEWWPDLYKDLKIFRMTGGEPLMDKNTFKVLDYVNENPSADLQLSITSNMCPPDQALFDKFVNSVKRIEEIRVWNSPGRINPDSGNEWNVAPATRYFSLFVSVDSVGEQAEYLRTGLEFERLLNNTRTFLKETSGTEVSFINTFNLLSIPKLKQFLQMILDLRVEFGYENQKELEIQPPDYKGFKHPPFIRKRRQRVWFDIPYLRDPKWLSVQNAGFYPELVNMVKECVDFMELNREKEDYGRTYHGFKDYEIAKLKRDLAWIEQGPSTVSAQEIDFRRSNFWRYFNELDERRGTSFEETFPELKRWWSDCFVSSVVF